MESKIFRVVAFVLFVVAALIVFGVATSAVTSATATTVAFGLGFSGLASWVLSTLF